MLQSLLCLKIERLKDNSDCCNDKVILKYKFKCFLVLISPLFQVVRLGKCVPISQGESSYDQCTCSHRMTKNSSSSARFLCVMMNLGEDSLYHSADETCEIGRNDLEITKKIDNLSSNTRRPRNCKTGYFTSCIE